MLDEDIYTQKDDFIGSIIPYPDILSENNNDILQEAYDLYFEQRYQEVYELLNPILRQKIDNLFFLYIYGQTLFWNENEKAKRMSCDYLSKIIGIIDSKNDNPDEIVIDLWFIDAYFKVGILCLDYQNYECSIYELSRVLNSGLELGDLGKEYLLSYLTGGYFYLNKHDIGNYFYNLTKENFPDNNYVNSFYFY